MSEVTVFAKITAKKGCAPQVLADLQNLVALVHKEPGCIVYKLHQDNEQPELFFFYEIWGSQALLDQHAAAPALTDFQKKTADTVMSLEVWVTNPV